MRKVLMVFVAGIILQACSTPPNELKSPCVGAKNSPCDRAPVNDWWIKAEA